MQIFIVGFIASALTAMVLNWHYKGVIKRIYLIAREEGYNDGLDDGYKATKKYYREQRMVDNGR